MSINIINSNKIKSKRIVNAKFKKRSLIKIKNSFFDYYKKKIIIKRDFNIDFLKILN